MIRLSDHFSYSRLLRYTLPSIIMLVFTSIYGVVDGFFVSNFVGKTPFAAVNFIMPFLMILAGSFSSEAAIMQNGFSLFPQDFSLEAYKTVFQEPMVVVRAYATTICLTIAGTLLGLALQTMTAYVLARKEFEWRNYFSFFFYFTTLFSGGLVTYYLLIRQTLHLADFTASVQCLQSVNYEELHSGDSGISD